MISYGIGFIAGIIVSYVFNKFLNYNTVKIHEIYTWFKKKCEEEIEVMQLPVKCRLRYRHFGCHIGRPLSSGKLVTNITIAWGHPAAMTESTEVYRPHIVSSWILFTIVMMISFWAMTKWLEM